MIRVAVACAALLSGCFMAGADYVRPSATDLHVPAEWTGGLGRETGDRLDVADWWQHLGDAQLTSLIARAVAASPDVAAVRARLHEARAQRGLAGAELWPSVTLGASGQYLDTSGDSGTGDRQELYSAGFDASWEPDIFGGRRRSLEAASADVEAATASLHDVHVVLAAEVARNYVELRSDQARIAIARANLASQSETLDLTRWRVQAGLASSVDFEQANTNVEQTRATIPTLETSRAEAAHRLATLLGLAPDALSDELAATVAIPSIPEPLTTGIPADVLRQRPDVGGGGADTRRGERARRRGDGGEVPRASASPARSGPRRWRSARSPAEARSRRAWRATWRRPSSTRAGSRRASRLAMRSRSKRLPRTARPC